MDGIMNMRKWHLYLGPYLYVYTYVYTYLYINMYLYIHIYIYIYIYIINMYIYKLSSIPLVSNNII